jgi:hypothetical protein
LDGFHFGQQPKAWVLESLGLSSKFFPEIFSKARKSACDAFF